MNPSSGRVAAEPLEVGARGRALAACLWRASSPRVLVALVHGLGEHGGRYAAFASDLAQAGYTSGVADWPGHGRSPGARGDASWTTVRDEVLPALIAALRAAAGESHPVVLLGHSMGGAMALDYALAHPGTLCAVIASAPAVRAARPPRWKLAAAQALRVLAPGKGIAHGLPLEGLSRDGEVVALYRSDPLVHGVISARLFFGLAEAQQRLLAQASTLSVPALVLAGSADAVVDPAGARAFVAAAPPDLARFVSCDDAYHEILNDVGRERVIREIVAWVDATPSLEAHRR